MGPHRSHRSARRAGGTATLAAAAAIMQACGSGGIADLGSTTVQTHLMPPSESLRPVVVATSRPHDGWPRDDYTLEDHSVDGDTLLLEIRYGGGCLEHRFALVVGPDFMESHPVQVAATLAHDARNDPCRAIVGRRLRFDLTPLRELWERSYGPGPGALILRLADRSILYEF